MMHITLENITFPIIGPSLLHDIEKIVQYGFEMLYNLLQRALCQENKYNCLSISRFYKGKQLLSLT